jgi:hypothetical protein
MASLGEGRVLIVPRRGQGLIQIKDWRQAPTGSALARFISRGAEAGAYPSPTHPLASSGVLDRKKGIRREAQWMAMTQK